jgi:hypothetical protein
MRDDVLMSVVDRASDEEIVAAIGDARRQGPG